MWCLQAVPSTEITYPRYPVRSLFFLVSISAVVVSWGFLLFINSWRYNQTNQPTISVHVRLVTGWEIGNMCDGMTVSDHSHHRYFCTIVVVVAVVSKFCWSCFVYSRLLRWLRSPTPPSARISCTVVSAIFFMRAYCAVLRAVTNTGMFFAAVSIVTWGCEASTPLFPCLSSIFCSPCTCFFFSFPFVCFVRL